MDGFCWVENETKRQQAKRWLLGVYQNQASGIKKQHTQTETKIDNKV